MQVFEATEFTNLLHSALNLYENGRYTESKEPLEEVLEMNSLFDYANEAMSRSYLQEENYEQALKYARVSKAFSVYSDSFWEVRNTWLRNNLIGALGIILLICILIWALKKVHQKKGIFNPVIKLTEKPRNSGYWQRLKYMAYYMKHPVDGAYGLRYEGKSSWITAGTLLTLTTLVYIINKYYCGFLLRNVREGRYTIMNDVLSIVGVFIVLTACNYLMCTINDGEGSFKRLFCGSHMHHRQQCDHLQRGVPDRLRTDLHHYLGGDPDLPDHQGSQQLHGEGDLQDHLPDSVHGADTGASGLYHLRAVQADRGIHHGSGRRGGVSNWQIRLYGKQ